MSQFIDHVLIDIRSGDGGNGMVAWRREKYEPLGGPAGGNGGRGGDLIFEATRDLNTLVDFRFNKKFEADNGHKGRPKGMHGKDAADKIIKVPVGTVIKDAESYEVIADLVQHGQRAMVAQGGRGGKGNTALATQSRKAPHFCEPGQPGIERKLELTLKILADVGIIGLPNAGKSTLLSVVSAAKPKIADYPFSTLSPQLGVVKTAAGESFVIADIPGLIEGASEGVGLGHHFLRHVERTRILVHLVDITSEHVEKDIETINNELRLYSRDLAQLPQCLVLSKTDLLPAEEADSIRARLNKKSKKDFFEPVRTLSAATGEGVEPLLFSLQQILSKLKADDQDRIAPVYVDAKATERPDSGFSVFRKKNLFFVEGDRVMRLVSITNMRDPESLHHMQHVLRAMGVIDALIKEGAKPGSEIVMGEITFTFGDQLA